MSGGESMERVIDLGAIRHNVRVMRRLVPEPAALLAVVKADAYGHGAAQVARASLEAGASALAVARPEEGTSLRAEGIGAPVLVLGNAMPETAREAVAGGLISTVSEPSST